MDTGSVRREASLIADTANTRAKVMNGQYPCARNLLAFSMAFPMKYLAITARPSFAAAAAAISAAVCSLLSAGDHILMLTDPGIVPILVQKVRACVS